MNADYLLPRMNEKSFPGKFLLLLFIVAICLLLATVIGFAIAIPFFGMESVMKLGSSDLLADHKGVGLLKFFQAVNQVGVFVMPALIFGYLVNRKPLDYLRLKTSFGVLLLILSLALIIASLPFINWLVELNEQLRLPQFMHKVEKWMRDTEDQTKILTDIFLKVDTLQGLLANLFIIAFLASVGEELLFRGVILKLLRELFGNIHLAIIFSAILFSALHLQFYGFLPRTLLGIMFGYLFVWSGSLWLPIILHFVFNGISVIAAYLYETGMIQTDLDSLGTSKDNLIVMGSAMLSCALIYFLFRIRKKKIAT